MTSYRRLAFPSHLSLLRLSNALSPSLSSLFIFPRAPGTRIFREHSKNHTKAHEPLPLASSPPLPPCSSGISIISFHQPRFSNSFRIHSFFFFFFFLFSLHVHIRKKKEGAQIFIISVPSPEPAVTSETKVIEKDRKFSKKGERNASQMDSDGFFPLFSFTLERERERGDYLPLFARKQEWNGEGGKNEMYRILESLWRGACDE